MRQYPAVASSRTPTAPGPALRARVHLLWTGGWDSTFQLLRLLLQYRLPVVPFYLIDPARRSSGIELQAMRRIRERIVLRDPAAAALLAPVRVHDMATLAPDPAIADAFADTTRAWFTGRQYEWLARFCAQQGIPDFELCVHRGDRAHGVVAPLAQAWSPRGYPSWRLDPCAPAAVQRLFGRFTFPLLGLTSWTWRPKQRRAAGTTSWP